MNNGPEGYFKNMVSRAREDQSLNCVEPVFNHSLGGLAPF
jgi:hypothetical protein